MDRLRHFMLLAFALVALMLPGAALPATAEQLNSLADRGQIDLVLSGSFTPRETRSIHQAAQVWNTLIGRPVFIIANNGASVTDDHVIFVTTMLAYDQENTLAVTHRAYDKQYISYLEYLRFDPVVLRRVLIHELGHALGLAHVEDQQSVMFPSIGTADMPTAPEILEVRQRWAL